MTCRHVRQLHDAYVDGELSSGLMAEVHAHLLQCPECQRRVEMIRACGSVIAKDHSEPTLDSGFASRVVAAIGQRSASSKAFGIGTQRARRRHRWRVAVGAGLPAAAAVLFFSVLIWPGAESRVAPEDVGMRLVAGGVVERPAQALENAKLAADSLNRVIAISMDEARQDVERGLQRVGKPGTSFLDLLLEPFTGLLDPPEPDTAGQDGDQEIVRF